MCIFLRETAVHGKKLSYRETNGPHWSGNLAYLHLNLMKFFCIFKCVTYEVIKLQTQCQYINTWVQTLLCACHTGFAPNIWVTKQFGVGFCKMLLHIHFFISAAYICIFRFQLRKNVECSHFISDIKAFFTAFNCHS